MAYLKVKNPTASNPMDTKGHVEDARDTGNDIKFCSMATPK
jgi:hypothetical protein